MLRFVNSSYFGFAREISTVKLALALVGIRTIKNFALWSAVYHWNSWFDALLYTNRKSLYVLQLVIMNMLRSLDPAKLEMISRRG